MSDVSSINSNQPTSPTPPDQDHRVVTTSNSIASSHSPQENDPLQNKELPPPAQKIVDAFLQSNELDEKTIESKKQIPSVSSSAESSSSKDGQDSSEKETSSQATATGSSNKKQSTEGLDSKEQKILDTALNSKVLSDAQKQQIEKKPEDFVKATESEGKHVKKEKQKKDDLDNQIAENADYNPEKDADTTIAKNPKAKPSHRL
jgi:hypothetical protein